MKYIRNLLCLWLITAAISSASVLQTFTTRASWEAATQAGFTTVDFENLSLPMGYLSYSTSAGLTTGGLSFVGVQGDTWSPYYLWAAIPGALDPDFANSGALLKGPEYRAGGAAYLSVTVPTGVTSFGLDLMSYNPTAQNFVIQLDGVNIGVVITTLAQPARQFFGFTADAPITNVRIFLDGSPNTSAATAGRFDNFVYGAAGAPGGGGGGGGEEAPEGTTMLCLGMGLVMVRWVKRRTGLLAGAAA